MEQRIYKRLRDLELFNVINSCLIGIIFGCLLNLQAITLNNGKMPIKSSGNFINDEFHINYLNDSEINRPFLTDRFGFESSSFILKFSIGDVLIIVNAILGTIIFMLFFIKKIEKR